MDTKIRRLAAAGAVAGFLTVFGVSLASAQEDPTTTTTVEESTDDATTDDPATDDRAADREGCPEKDDASTEESAEAGS
jgi:hypothetical protein